MKVCIASTAWHCVCMTAWECMCVCMREEIGSKQLTDYVLRWILWKLFKKNIESSFNLNVYWLRMSLSSHFQKILVKSFSNLVRKIRNSFHSFQTYVWVSGFYFRSKSVQKEIQSKSISEIWNLAQKSIHFIFSLNILNSKSSNICAKWNELFKNRSPTILNVNEHYNWIGTDWTDSIMELSKQPLPWSGRH